METKLRTNVCPEVSSSLDLDIQVLIHLADDLYRMADS